MGVSVGERRNVQTRGRNRVSTINLLGCSTSVALTMGPTDEEEEEDAVHVSDGFSVHHQELKTAHKGSGICQTVTAT